MNTCWLWLDEREIQITQMCVANAFKSTHKVTCGTADGASGCQSVLAALWPPRRAFVVGSAEEVRKIFATAAANDATTHLDTVDAAHYLSEVCLNRS